jgi:hypothetical protein
MSEGSKRVMSTLLVLGAMSPERGLEISELAAKVGADEREIRPEVEMLVRAGYAELFQGAGGPRVFLTGTGIITASSTYS